jgi:hypothetical protein
MWKIVVVLLLTALAILMARLAADAPVIETRTGVVSLQTTATPPLMYAGVRG